MGIEAAGMGEGGMKSKLPVLAIARPAKLEAARHHLHVALA